MTHVVDWWGRVAVERLDVSVDVFSRWELFRDREVLECQWVVWTS
jgi:hypothetical protein